MQVFRADYFLHFHFQSNHSYIASVTNTYCIFHYVLLHVITHYTHVICKKNSSTKNVTVFKLDLAKLISHYTLNTRKLILNLQRIRFRFWPTKQLSAFINFSQSPFSEFEFDCILYKSTHMSLFISFALLYILSELLCSFYFPVILGKSRYGTY